MKISIDGLDRININKIPKRSEVDVYNMIKYLFLRILSCSPQREKENCEKTHSLVIKQKKEFIFGQDVNSRYFFLL